MSHCKWPEFSLDLMSKNASNYQKCSFFYRNRKSYCKWTKINALFSRWFGRFTQELSLNQMSKLKKKRLIFSRHGGLSGRKRCVVSVDVIRKFCFPVKGLHCILVFFRVVFNRNWFKWVSFFLFPSELGNPYKWFWLQSWNG